jgi:hypothetical protein
VILLAASVAGQDYGPVSLDDVDALTLNWNQIQWLVKDQIKEVEELREEHNELYNEITRCFGNEKCLAEFELLDMSPGSKLHGLGLRALDLSGSAMSRMREEVLQTKARLDEEMRERWTMDKKIKEDQARLAAQEEALAAAEAKRVSSSSSLSSSSSSASRGSSSTLSRGGSSSSSSWSTSSSSYSRGSGGGQAQGQMFFGRNSPISSGSSSSGSGPLFSSVNTTFGQTPIVYERRYEYSQSSHNRGRHSG